MKRSLIWLFCLSFLITACATSGPQKHTSYSLMGKDAISSTEENKDLIVRIRPITDSNYEQYPSLYTQINYTTDPVQGRRLTKRSTRWVVAPLPAFEATITNNTGHVIRFNKAVIKLQDESGNMYDCVSKRDLTILSQNTIQYFGANKEIYVYDSSPIVGCISTLSIIDNNFELLPNLTQKGYILFNLPPQYEWFQHYQFMGSHQYFKLILFEIPIETDQAGEVTKTTNFEFYYDVIAEKIAK